MRPITRPTPPNLEQSQDMMRSQGQSVEDTTRDADQLRPSGNEGFPVLTNSSMLGGPSLDLPVAGATTPASEYTPQAWSSSTTNVPAAATPPAEPVGPRNSGLGLRFGMAQQ